MYVDEAMSIFIFFLVRVEHSYKKHEKRKVKGKKGDSSI